MLFLRNAGARNITQLGNWSIYFNWVAGGAGLLNPIALPSPTAARVRIVGRNVDHWFMSWQLTSANSWLVRRIASNDSISSAYSFQPNETVEVRLRLMSRSYVFPRWYVTAPGLRPRVLRSTAGDDANFVRAFGHQPPPVRFDNNLNEDFGGAAASARVVRTVLPTPLIVRIPRGAETSGVKINESWKIVFTARPLSDMAKYLSGRCTTFVLNLSDEAGGTL